MVTLQEINDTRNKLPEEIVRTPLLQSEDLSDRFGCSAFLKCENLQVTGSYKSRAAFTILNNLSSEQKRTGAAISSSGNFASAFAFMGRLLNIPTTVVMMEKTAPFKVEKTKRYGAEVVLCENRFEARWETLDKLERERGMVAINTFEAPEVVAGHGTIGLEILQDLGDVETILVPISSGGLLAGIATAVKEIDPRVKLIGVQPEGSNAMYQSFKEGSPQSIDKVDTMCDALVATKPGALPFEHVQKYVDDVVLVDEDSVKQAVALLFEAAKLVVEPSGAVGIAAILAGKVLVDNQKVVALLSGGNVSKDTFVQLVT
ncbi:threonine/serine dehydratase [candidate division KSB1 bacterium]|nr:threonine/serine dehydratase [candidate division KSB1 bacterium]NIR70586.1 threonine/serine dehydratase [candidate division KSB1 bacterium]NIS27722.1 threonine/serine dehydratase [candidate division KSB1 bacterium]NIT74550.1 threonine/serine dehydratase [candidate division KSB1 bacterium]NIU28375.1 threonine/serine dehydratase [candidate division KSB1 bacterium]